MKIQTINPATEEPINEYELMTKEEVFSIAKKSRDAFLEWKTTDISERAVFLRNSADILRQKKNEFAELITQEMGKPIKQSISEIEKCALTCEVYADNSEKWLHPEQIHADGKKHFVRYEPLGVIVSIMPWNFPFWQAFRFAAPVLMAGNTSILKHASNVTGCSLAIESVFQEAGLEDVFHSVIAKHDSVNELIASDLTAGVSLTGSVSAGQKVASIAGANLKKVVMELGGSDPFIVLEDADIDKAAKIGVQSRLINNGQSCIAAKRFIVVEKIADSFTEKFVEHTKKIIVGEPMDMNTDVGPLANTQQRQEVESQLNDSIKSGAMLLYGGKKLERKGYFFEPAVLSDINENMRIFREEVFGPVAPIIVVKNEDEAIQTANNSEFGLGSAIWTSDEERALNIAKRIDSGAVFINGIVKSDARVPFGGIKKSGIGRELGSFGLKEFTNVKAVNVY